MTNVNPANALDIFPQVEVPSSHHLIKKCACVAGTTLTSSVVKNKVVKIISGATFMGLYKKSKNTSIYKCYKC